MILRLLKDVTDLGVRAFGLFVLVLLMVVGEIGFQTGRRRPAKVPPPDNEMAGISTLITGMLALMAFTLALTISFAQDRFETRRHAMLSEANTIGTAWLRAGLAGAPGRPIAALIEDHARARLAYVEAITAIGAATAIGETNRLQGQIWQRTLPVLQGMPAPLAGVLVSSLNDMFDANLAERWAFESRVPTETQLTLLVGAMLAIGDGSDRRTGHGLDSFASTLRPWYGRSRASRPRRRSETCRSSGANRPAMGEPPPGCQVVKIAGGRDPGERPEVERSLDAANLKRCADPAESPFGKNRVSTRARLYAVRSRANLTALPRN
jgi:hypothetical protein